MSDDLANLLLALGIFSAGFIAIGPNILAIIGTSMERGRRQGTALALGVGAGTGLWATLTVTGLTALVSAYAQVLFVIKIIGAGYLLFLAYKAFRSAMTPDEKAATRAAQGGNLFWRGVVIQITNPKAALQWIAIVGIGLGAGAPTWAAISLVVIATALSLLVHSAYAVTFSTAPVIQFYRRARRWIDGALGVLFTGAAIKLATSRT
ncbi:MAG: LysE family translocator [Alphaproteobacteria bacterium]|nr:LysE family translocator [Alphaproteobacteria bacterium]